jgi:hypothetical protein
LLYETEGKFVGEGTAGLVTCDGGKCPSNDLVWAGDFPVGGVFFIQVTNNSSAPKTYQFVITGSGVVLGH